MEYMRMKKKNTIVCRNKGGEHCFNCCS